MSRLGKKPIDIPNGVKVDIKDRDVKVTGPKGTLECTVPDAVTVKVDGAQVVVELVSTERNGSAMWGLARAMVNNMVVGVSDGFKKELVIKGVGYQAAMSGNMLTLRLGYSHPVEYTLPAGITCDVPKDSKGTLITISGIDKQAVGQAAATIRSFRKPDAYLGKGIRYSDEQLTLKEGKSVG
jgi:large subunit ribosomal protein L6